ncbi:MAG: ABC transporter ATP-binding protein [Anaerolineae bacterium]|nr:ABC transporter ATP-binding protein [Anaerolineae bacterium]
MEQTTSVRQLPWSKDRSDRALLSVRDMVINYQAERGAVQAVRGVEFDIFPGESLALIGESGCGKTTLGLGMIRLLVKTAEIVRGKVIYRHNGTVQDVMQLDQDELRQYRWGDCAMVFQSALSAFNPVLRIRDQMYETVKAHRPTTRAEVNELAEPLLTRVQLDPERVMRSYPHELSGGMRQRVLIAMALLLNPPFIILDEPTTALDILTQRTIIDLLRALQADFRFAMMFISHDLSLAAELANHVATMYAGRIVEYGTVNQIFYEPRHPYTLGLIKAVPTVTGAFEDLSSIAGSPPDLIDLPSGCKFHVRCPFATERCSLEEPELQHIGPEHAAACFFDQEVERQADRAWNEIHNPEGETA